MKQDIKKLEEFNELVTMNKGERDIVVYNPKWTENESDEFITKDLVEWKMTPETEEYVKKLLSNFHMSDETRIISLYEELSKKYVYDDNLISYIQKVRDGLYTVPDWYGRQIDEVWENNRKNHNRRVCFELAREFAAGLNEIFKDNDDYNICILWDIEQTHYYVGLTCSEYSLTLDMDDFSGIKDLTRLKAGLTLEGIKIMPGTDKNAVFRSELQKYNERREKSGYNLIKNERFISDNIDEPEQIGFLRKAMEFMTEDLKLDSQGVFEYMKELIGCSLGGKAREKIWKKIPGDETDTRYIRCLLVNKDGETYLIDGDSKEVRLFDKEEFEKEDRIYLPFDELERDRKPYSGK